MRYAFCISIQGLIVQAFSGFAFATLSRQSDYVTFAQPVFKSILILLLKQEILFTLQSLIFNDKN